MAGISVEAAAKVRAAWPAIVQGFAAGELVKDVLARAGVTSDVLYAYMRAEPGARREWEDAREESGHAFMDRALDEAFATVDKEYAQHVRTRIDTLKWAARVRNPKAYSDKATLDVNVRTVDLTRIISDANARLAAQRQGRIINAEPVSNNSGATDVRALAGPAQSELTAALDPALLALL
jgi:hypothetical protein